MKDKKQIIITIDEKDETMYLQIESKGMHRYEIVGVLQTTLEFQKKELIDDNLAK